MIGFKTVRKFLSDCLYPHYIRNRSQWNAMWRDNHPHGCSRPILFPRSAKHVGDCRQNIPWLLWNALLTTPHVSEHYKYMFLVARDLYEMFVLHRGKHTTRRSTVGIWSEVRVYRTPATNIPWAGGLRLGKFPDNRRSMCEWLETRVREVFTKSVQFSYIWLLQAF